ncbi:MAG: RNA ligase (ATP) [Saprospiraceae bacterium]|nr:RNA ligase (ATP) [Saprospiraceae bacterium]
MRKLASIQRIKALDPIENADAIEKATVLGWQLVVKKGEFQVGELCVYCEIDSLMPDRPEFDFLKPRGMRIRTVRLRGQISQGICFPLNILRLGIAIEEDSDVTEALGIEKYEPPIPADLAGIAKGPFPGFLQKTDETRVQILQERLDAFVGEPCYTAEKLDGSSVTYFMKNGEFGVCSRNLNLLETSENTLWKLARAHQIEEKLRSLGSDFALQGEVIGEGIQSNKYQLKGQKVCFFNAFDIAQYRYADFEEFVKLMADFGLETVPILDTAFRLVNDIAALVEMAIAPSVLNPKLPREGLVIRPLKEKTDALGRVSFKAINPEFLLKYE